MNDKTKIDLNSGDVASSTKPAAQAALSVTPKKMELGAVVGFINAITRSCNEAPSFDHALKASLNQICGFSDWPVGHAYAVTRSGDGIVLVPTGIWSDSSSDAFESFRQITETVRFSPGEGLPGRVFATGEPRWIVDVTEDPNFPRAELEQNIGVHSAFAFPVLIGHEVAAVLEFFTPSIVEPELDFLAALSQTGIQLGHVIERERDQAEAEELRNRLTHFAEAASDWFWETDSAHRFTYVSNRFEQTTGIDRNVVMGRTREELANPEQDSDIWNAHVDDLNNQRPFRDFQYWWFDDQEKKRWFRLNGLPFTDNKGRFAGYRGTGSEVTKQVEAETLNTRFVDAIEGVPVGFALFDQDDRLVLFNEKYKELSSSIRDLIVPGVRFEALLWALLDRNVIPEAIGREEEWIRMRLDKRHNPTGPFQLLRTDASLEVRDHPTADGGHLTILVDITDRRAIEEQLRQAQKMEAVGQLTGGIAHDFNNLLAIIVGNAELLRETLDEQGVDTTSFLPPLLRAAGRGTDLTQRLLAFSRKQTLHPVAVRIDRLISGMEDLLHRSLGEAIDVSLTADNELWTCEVDPGQLENALLNLCLNSRDAMNGTGRLTLKTENRVLTTTLQSPHDEIPPGEYVTVSVADEGCGIGADSLSHVLEPFFTTKDVGRGSGLGLSMVYGFVQQSRGHLSIESTPGTGTVVTLYFPGSEKDLASESGEELPDRHDDHRGNILIIEDDPDVLELTAAMLESLGYDIRQASGYDTAMPVLNSDAELDVLLSDVVLRGGTSGPEIAQKALEIRPDLKVVFMSGFSDSAYHDKAGLLAAAPILNKPFRKSALADFIGRVIDNDPAD